jgi:hypothetical protein
VFAIIAGRALFAPEIMINFLVKKICYEIRTTFHRRLERMNANIDREGKARSQESLSLFIGGAVRVS